MQKHGFLSHMGRYLKYNKNTLTLRINLQLQQQSHQPSSVINVECSNNEHLDWGYQFFLHKTIIKEVKKSKKLGCNYHTQVGSLRSIMNNSHINPKINLRLQQQPHQPSSVINVECSNNEHLDWGYQFCLHKTIIKEIKKSKGISFYHSPYMGKGYAINIATLALR